MCIEFQQTSRQSWQRARRHNSLNAPQMNNLNAGEVLLCWTDPIQTPQYAPGWQTLPAAAECSPLTRACVWTTNRRAAFEHVLKRRQSDADKTNRSWQAAFTEPRRQSKSEWGGRDGADAAPGFTLGVVEEFCLPSSQLVSAFSRLQTAAKLI